MFATLRSKVSSLGTKLGHKKDKAKAWSKKKATKIRLNVKQLTRSRFIKEIGYTVATVAMLPLLLFKFSLSGVTWLFEGAYSALLISLVAFTGLLGALGLMMIQGLRRTKLATVVAYDYVNYHSEPHYEDLEEFQLTGAIRRATRGQLRLRRFDNAMANLRSKVEKITWPMSKAEEPEESEEFAEEGELAEAIDVVIVDLDTVHEGEPAPVELDMSVIESLKSPKKHDWAQYGSSDMVEVAYDLLAAKAAKADRENDWSYWTARLFARQAIPQVGRDAVKINALWIHKIDRRNHDLHAGKQGITDEVQLHLDHLPLFREYTDKQVK